MALVETNDWETLIERERKKDYFKALETFLEEESSSHLIYPPKKDRFQALELTPYNETKVVMLGQDPYHGPNQAHGLSFSVKVGEKIPPSLRNIYKELRDDLGCEIPVDGYLVPWAKQGILLLNTVLTVREKEAASHRRKGWETFTDEVIKALNDKVQPVIFVLWGKHAQEKKAMITNPHHYVIESVHPSPLSARRGFFGSKPFSKINQILQDENLGYIDW
ncbi:uracil-DNA glycosylase [Halalkalibacter krulwichiae]|uniref:uracil-DNA glycosylase n=1 Tax=Halalkalibacter krulwichiae TaxID=199441 RepID=UPI0035303022